MRTKRIKGIKFGLLSPKEIRKMSAARIITADTYGEDGFPIEMGLVNQRIGVIDPGLRCKTCGGRMGECPGHFGHIELAAPVIHVGYAKLIYRMLNATCRKCGRVLLEGEYFLCSVTDADADAETERGLNKGVIPEELCDVFKTNDVPLSNDVGVTKEKNGEWVVVTGKNMFIIKKEDGELNIYDAGEKRSFLREIELQREKQTDVGEVVKRVFKEASKKGVCTYCGDYLFSINTEAASAGLENGINEGVIPEELKKTFAREGSPLSKNATIRKEIDNRWVITGKDKTYTVKKEEEEKLNVYCGLPQRVVKYDKPTAYVEIDEKERERRLMPTDVRERLERIPDEEIALFGMRAKDARPEWMVLTVLPVPPVTARPSITLESGQRSEDDLTHKLVDIIRINQRFMENRDAGAPQLIIEDLWELLQYHVSTYFDNEIAGLPPARHRSGRPLKTMSQRLKGKEGRFRGSLSGKRVNFSARTVISPDPDIDIDEVGVPEEIAKELTIGVNVTERNLGRMKEIVMKGREHPGANYVRRADGKKVKITESNYEALGEEIDVGWKVERHIGDGDIVLFNRQPSLHRVSLMAHYVRVMPGKTFRLNPAVCPPYNADYDGDEMNLHVLQTEEARAEAKILMAVQHNIISPRFGRPIIGGIHDHITGLFLLTHGEKRFEKEEVLEVLRKIDIDDLGAPAGTFVSPPGIGMEVPYWTGKQIFGMILPKELNLQFRGKMCEKCIERGLVCEKEKCPREAYVIIKEGEVICGVIDEMAIGSFKGRIIDKIFRQYGEEAAKRFINDASRIAINYILQAGFSFGISDEDIPSEGKRQIREEAVREAEKKVDALIRAYDAEELEALPGRTLEETLELLIMQELGRARDAAGAIAERDLGMENAAVLMAKSGARGSLLNLTQMAACVGQQSVRGERIRRGYQGRTLPHFKPGDRSANARGFVKSSFKDGLSSTEYFFHAVGGREALVDTAVRTSQSGYFQRRLVNALQDLEVKNDETVRETRDTIVQFKYGEDSVDPSKGEYGKVVDIDEIIREAIGAEVGA
ncbi:DNA-directed RNA polymerase subunit beta' [subsurface metagenome]|nr:DNA-directed RNA polymerase subunit A' [Methanosarcinales archaeon]